jgi:hypothetical protein
MSTRRRFTEEFKLEAVKQVVERGFGVRDGLLGWAPHRIACMPGLINMAFQLSSA